MPAGDLLAGHTKGVYEGCFNSFARFKMKAALTALPGFCPEGLGLMVMTSATARQDVQPSRSQAVTSVIFFIAVSVFFLHDGLRRDIDGGLDFDLRQIDAPPHIPSL